MFVLPPALVASRIDYNVAGTVPVLRDISEHGLPPPPAWLADLKVIGPLIHARWQALARPEPAAVERVQAFVAWARLQLIGAGLSLGNAVVQLILAMLTAFFLYRDGVAVQRGLVAAGTRIAGDHAPRLLRVAYATIIGVVYGVLGTALAQALLLLIGLWVTGIPAALLLGLLLFVLSLIPLGPLSSCHSHGVSPPVSSSSRAGPSGSAASAAAIASGSVATRRSRTTAPPSSSTHTEVCSKDTSSPA